MNLCRRHESQALSLLVLVCSEGGNILNYLYSLDFFCHKYLTARWFWLWDWHQRSWNNVPGGNWHESTLNLHGACFIESLHPRWLNPRRHTYSKSFFGIIDEWQSEVAIVRWSQMSARWSGLKKRLETP